MLFVVIPLLVATAVNAAPYARRGLAQVVSQCKHDFSYSFDDGPYIYHNEILDDFNGVGGKTTFFMNGDNYGCIYDQANVDAIRRSFEQGHQIASHTWSHAALDTLTHAQIDYEIQRLDEAFIKIIGVKPKFIRPPYGSLNEDAASYIQNTYGKTIVTWSDDSGDSTGGSAQSSYNFYNNFANQGPGQPHMALSHETQAAAIGALRQGTVTRLNQAGIKLLTVAQCLDAEPYEYISGYGQRDSTWYCGGSWTPGTTPPPTSTTSSPPPTSTTSSPPPSGTCASTYRSAAGDTCTSIEQKFGLPAGSILASNSFLNCDDIWVNTPICIPPGGSSSSSSTSSSSTPAPSCVSTYRSVAGDTCTSIEAKFGLSAGAISQANSFVTCTDIWVNTPLCIPPGGSPPTTGGQCTRTIRSTQDATCDSIGAANGVSGAQIKAWNDFLDCNDIWTNTPVCVAH